MSESTTPTCAAGCPMCPMSESDEGLRAWEAAHEAASGDDLRGWRLLGRSAVAFVVPTIGAVVGVVSVGGGETRRFFGLVAGAAGAMIVSVLAGRFLPGRSADRPAPPIAAAVTGVADEE